MLPFLCNLAYEKEESLLCVSKTFGSQLKNFIVELTYRVHGQVLISKGIFGRNLFL